MIGFTSNCNLFSYRVSLTTKMSFLGVVCNGHLRCAQHGARFVLDTGDVTDYPSLDCLQSYQAGIIYGIVR